MDDRINYLKSCVNKKTEDIGAFFHIFQREYAAATDRSEISRKAHFLSCFAREIPVMVDEKEWICGSMRFWRNDINGCNMGHIIVDYRMILREGIGSIRKKLSGLWEEELSASGETGMSRDGEAGEAVFAMCEAMEAFALLVQRYGEAAWKLYEKSGNSDVKTVAENCFYIVENPPETFHQALQLVWFVHLFLHAEGMSAALSFGRFDQYLYPYYKKDLEKGVLTRDRAKELLACFWLKTCEGDESQNLTVGGDSENELTYLCIDVTAELKVQQPSLSVRTHAGSSDILWQKIVRLIKCGIGMPAVFHDETIISALKYHGVSEEDACNYGIVGCYEANPDGCTYGSTACAGKFYLHDVLLAFLEQKEIYGDFGEFYKGFQVFFTEYYNTVILVEFRKNWEEIRTRFVSPFQSACMGGCLETGIPAEHGGCKYTMCGINILGIGTLIDSLYVMKHLIFEEKEYTYADFVDQVLHNFPDRELAVKCKNYPGKYGTDQPETNQMAEELSLFIAELVKNGEIAEGVIPYSGLFIFLNDIRSERYPATPDGRLAGERISYGIAASDFCTGKTVTSLLNAASHIANDHFADGNPLMFHIGEKEVEGSRGDRILESLIKSYFEKGGFHVQINLTDRKTLEEAQAEPDAYQDLIIRISGYSEYFNRLDYVVQNALIERS